MFDLVLNADSGVERVVRIGSTPVLIGRAPTNDVIVTDDTVSSRHLTVWCSPSRVWIEDLRSRNGTWVNGTRIQGIRRIVPGDAVLLGKATRLELRSVPETEMPSTTGSVLLIEDLDAGLRYPVRSDRFVIDDAADVDLRLPTEVRVVLLVHDGGELWLGRGDDQVQLPPDGEFEAGGHRLRAIRVPQAVGATRELDTTRYPYALTATLQPPAGPCATLVDQRDGRRHVVTGETRAILMYLLARRHEEDRVSGVPDDGRGWCDDEDLIAAIWGKIDGAATTNHLNVLVGRIRREIGAAGFDPWCLEKRRGYLRIRVDTAEVSPPCS
jgi:pSer/pThr/pTyr-binding forkhead associated (FHA) protein